MATSRSRKPRHAGGYVRISDDPSLDEEGVTRQKEDVEALAARLGWTIGKVYQENDTSAYKRKRIRLANGRSMWRVDRPEFRQMLQDYEDGVIDGIIVYDLDRLARQPRDLEDLIDLVDHFKRPVEGVTGSLDLMTDGGKTMARVLVAMANKSSADTARRVSRQRLQRAQEGRNLPPNRAFGWKEDRVTLEPDEAALLCKAITGYTAGETWSSATRMFKASGISPTSGKTWYLSTIKNMMLSPRVAGIVPYRGTALQPQDAEPDDDEQTGEGPAPHERRRTRLTPRALALRDASGAYVRGNWDPIVTVEQWEAFITEYEHRREGVTFTPHGTRKYLLSGLLRCARPGDDGTPCGKRMVGKATRRGKSDPTPIYVCPNKGLGGCGRCQRGMAWLDNLIEDLLFLHLETNRPSEEDQLPEPQRDHPDAVKLTDVQNRLKAMREGMRDGKVTPESFFTIVPGLEAQEKKLISSLSKARRTHAERAQRLKTPEQVREEWEDATVEGRRAILAQYLQAIMVHPTGSGRGYDHNAIVPVWKPLPQ